ncbi:MAG TPA: class I SAM-dependent methyltransferase [Chloroflexia bacterium]|nr:class I SAM-dependent methyltransferase [Chloroflexia bacterium]
MRADRPGQEASAARAPAGPLHFLAYRARIGGAGLHPRGAAATVALLAALDLRDGQRVLEVGCGTAETLVRVATHAQLTLDGVEVLPAMLRVARQRLRLTGLARQIRLYATRPGAPLPGADNVYDRVYTESVLGFQDAATAAGLLREIGRVLRPGGLYVANEAIWKPPVTHQIATAINTRCRADFGLPLAAEQPWRVDDWTAQIQAAGLQVLHADLLDSAPRPPLAGPAGRSWRLVVSRLLTGYYQSKPYWIPGLRRQRRHYRRLLRAHAGDGLYLEARLFVVQKPAAR